MQFSHSRSPSRVTSIIPPASKIQQPQQPNHNHNQPVFRLAFRQQGNRIVIPRKEPPLPLQSKTNKIRRTAIQSANISRERIQIEDLRENKNLQFSRDPKNRSKNWHKRTKSNHVQLHEIKEDQLSNFSNSLQNISQEVIQIPFAKKIIMPTHLLRNAGSLDSKTSSSIEKRVGSPSFKLNFHKNSLEKNKNKQNCQSIAKPDKFLKIPKPKAKQQSALALSDFNLKAIKITEGGSIVYLAAHKKTNCIVAIKSIKKRLIRPNIKSFIAQLKLGLLINHPNVVKIYGIFSDSDNIYVVKEYMEEGAITQRRRKLAQSEIGCEINHILSAVLAILPVLGCCWCLEIKNIAQSHSISKLTSIQVNLNGTEECFSEKLKACLHFLVDADRRSDTKDYFQTNESIHLNMLRNGSYLLCSFRQMLQSILILTENEILMLWNAHFLKQYRLKALMLQQK